jgi:2'-5' RNA ligase
MRLFVAINFSADTKNKLITLRDELRAHSERGKFSPPENLHLTLVFLGECDGERTAAAKAVTDGVSFEPFDLTVERVGRFKRDGGDVWWAGVREEKALLDLQRDLTDRLIDIELMKSERVKGKLTYTAI